MNIRKIIKEELLREVGGYDDPDVMSVHAGATISRLTDAVEELTLIVSGLSNALMNGSTKEDIRTYLAESSDEIETIKSEIKKNIKNFTEDRLISESKTFLTKLIKFQKKINVLVDLSGAMGSDQEYFERVKGLLIELVPSLKTYSDELKATSKMFYDRFNIGDRSGFGSGFDFN